LPDFVIAGERRSGTTSLYHWLKSHPDVYLPDPPDFNYFIEEEIVSARRWRSGKADAAAWERTHQPADYAAHFAAGTGFRVAGHKGADLLFWREAHARMRRFLPDGRFLIVLRDPVARAWSHYWNEVGKGRESLSFEAAIEAEHERIAASDYARDHLSYLARGFYARSLRLFFETLPRERTLVLILEEMRRDPATALAGVHRFLGLDPGRARLPDKLEHNANWTTEPRFPSAPGLVRLLEHGWGRLSAGLVRRLTRDTERRRTWRNRANWPFRKTVAGRAMPAALKARLRDHYAAANRELAEMLERDLQDWNQ